jgi:hypothetical protein
MAGDKKDEKRCNQATAGGIITGGLGGAYLGAKIGAATGGGFGAFAGALIGGAIGAVGGALTAQGTAEACGEKEANGKAEAKRVVGYGLLGLVVGGWLAMEVYATVAESPIGSYLFASLVVGAVLGAVAGYWLARGYLSPQRRTSLA